MRPAKLILALCLFALVLPAGFAQSGRKQKKGADQPPVQGVPKPTKTPEPPVSDVPEPDPEKEKAKEKERASAKGIILGTDWADMNVGSGVSDYVRNACLAELRRVVRGLEVRASTNLNRGDAVKGAKNEDRFYTVLMEFSTMMSQLEVRYTIYEPKTAKVLGMGSALIQTDSSGRSSYYYYERAGRDVARQIISRLDLRSSRFP